MLKNALLSCCVLLVTTLVIAEYGCTSDGAGTSGSDGSVAGNGGSTGGGGVGQAGNAAQGGVTGQGGSSAQGGVTGQGGNSAQGGITGQGGSTSQGGRSGAGGNGAGGNGLIPACPVNPAGMDCPMQGDQCEEGANGRCFCFGGGNPTWRCARVTDGGITFGDASIAMCPAGTMDMGVCDGTIGFCTQNGGGCRCRNMSWNCF